MTEANYSGTALLPPVSFGLDNKVPAVYGAISTVAAKLAKSGIAKDRKNEQQNYKFRGIDDVYNALSTSLSSAGLVALPRVLERTVTERATRNGGALFYAIVIVEYDLVATVDGSKHTVRVIGEAMDSGDKATNKAMSAAYKYMAMQVFCIPTEGDNDADATTHEVAASVPKSADKQGDKPAQNLSKNMTSAQIVALQAALAATKLTETRVAKAYGVTKLADIPASEFDGVVARLKNAAKPKQ